MQDIKPVVDQHTIVMRNVARWQEEQKRKEQKRQKLAADAQRQNLTVPQLLAKRRERVLLQSGRATIASIVAAHVKAAS